jgi:aryl-alcohol dehydrogenase-like predicted oxidoreductase
MGLSIVEDLRALVPAGMQMATWALRWILMEDAVTCAIPGAKRPTQVDENVTAADLPPLPAMIMAKIRELYDRRVKPLVHQYW